MRSLRIIIITLGIGLTVLSSCATKYGMQLKNGDLLLVSANDSQLSGAIDRVTQTTKSTHYSHIGMLEKEGTDYWVLHAGTRNGSERVPLDHFLRDEQHDNNHVDVYRLKPQYQKSIPSAIVVAKRWLGKPYNYSYILSDDKLYCSDFVQRSFARDSIFQLDPMTFVNPKTGKTDAAWEVFYQKQSLEVPEGLPGCNPNGMAASPKINFLGKIREQK
ncbi:YiiX/YebB-like N1pC/P60 family cysteine hydrolase [Elizabethkingia meningoseptica]|uniref:YiiX/YebB-like N1pC/P60 family cysteine hydrolase n=1 Tax=Elizabethkingia meningoseptica TaxID=238 RepID=UPI000841280D|nr:YiiX/YebB-like N1pC/P60 family cysteine hydrolase [Elizabethkingia meningoseptica]MEC4710549.1 YiiX/YebB-like N1pC/P60 family cysteine hydrolase [Elizabethkingia meningoseptica]ODM53124.1 hypothetical protein BES09_09810 [Elizabethkingia meningoseptica]OHT28028.1 hypothetical protein BFF93_09820 [Elizabethkingia meningoseptica]OPC04523.1 hypothetical protein BAS10_15785 [Elizabethkingia meningoseptica]OPC07170.1 hypothetical protein BAX93_14480 [Elizabethkingia meningoseptica]